MSPRSRSTRADLRLVAPVIAYAVLIFTLSSLPGSEVPSTGLPNGDKLLHVAEYFLFGILLLLPTQSLGWRGCGLSLAVGVAYGAFDEFHQSFVPGRSADILDLAADIVGLVLAVTIAAVVWRSRDAAKATKDAPAGGKV